MARREHWLGSAALTALGVVMLAQGLGGDATADELFMRDRNVGVLFRDRPDFRPEGVKAGQFIVRPRLDVGLGYTTNAFALSDIPLDRQQSPIEQFEDEADTYFLARPSVTAESLWSRHALRAGGYVEAFQNRQFDDEGVTNFGTFLDGRLDMASDTAIIAGLSYDELNEARRANTAAILTAEPINYTVGRAYIGVRHDFNRFRFESRLDARTFDFNDVVIIPIQEQIGQSGDQDFRDRTDVEVSAQAAYALSPDTSLFLRGAYNEQNYDLGAGDLQLAGRPERGSKGWNVSVGSEFDITRLIRGSVAVGVFDQNYDAPEFGSVDGLYVDAGVEWFPREQTTVALNASRGADEAALFDAGGVISTEVVLRADQEIRSDVIGYALIGTGSLDFPDAFPAQTAERETLLVEQNIDRTRAGTGVTWYMNQNTSTTIDYAYESQDVRQDIFTGGFDTDHDIHQLLVTVSLYR